MHLPAGRWSSFELLELIPYCSISGVICAYGLFPCSEAEEGRYNEALPPPLIAGYLHVITRMTSSFEPCFELTIDNLKSTSRNNIAHL